MFSKRRRLVLLLVVVTVAAAILIHHRLAAPAVRPGSYLLLHIHGDYPEEAPPDLLGRLIGRGAPTMAELISALHVAALDARIAGAVVRVGPLEIGWAKAEDLRSALAALRAAGKKVHAVMEHEAVAANKEYFLASAANRVYLSPAATAPLAGLASRFLFLGGVWEKLDVEMHVEKIREYKTLGDMLQNKSMSPYHREMATSLLDSISARLISAIAEARHLDRNRVEAIIDDAPVTGEEFVAAGLADGVRYASEVIRQDAANAPTVDLEEYRKVTAASVGHPPTHRIAVVYGVGAIAVGESGGSAARGRIMGSETVVQAFREAQDNEEVKAIVFRVDSPGGSALASDLIWRATREAREKKPVIVSMSDLAASGGYYIAAGADRILAQPTTLTGSIGVVFARPNIEGLLRRLGIATETIARGKYARINDITTPVSADLRAKMVAQMDHIYAQFVDRVARSRNLPPERVDAIGRGRVWTGSQAAENGLVDELGGFLEAIDAAKAATGIPKDAEVQLVFYPRRKTLAERLAEALATRLLPPFAAELRAALALSPFARPGVLALMPEEIVIQ